MKKTRFMAAVVAMMMVATFATGCANSSSGTSSSKVDGSTTGDAVPTDPIKLGFLGPLTGELAQYGVAVQKGVQMYIEEVNAAGGVMGRQIEVIYYDEKGDSVEALSAFNRLVSQDGVVAIIGDVTSTPTIAVAQESANMPNPIPMITASGTANEITSFGDNMFRSCFLDPFQGETMARYAAEVLNAKKVAVIYDVGQDYSVGLTNSFVEVCEANGVTVVARESYSAGSVDFNTQLTNIQNQNPDVIFCPDYYGTVTLIAQQARNLGMNQPLLGCDGWDGVLNVATDTKALENCFFSNHYSSEDTAPIVQNFLTNYKTKYNEDPMSFAATAYDAAKILCEAMTAAGTTDSAAVIEAMKKTNAECVTGNITFDENNNPVKTCAIVTVKDGAYKLDRKY